MIEHIELTQENYLEAMHLLEFTPEQIENNGLLHLSDDVAIACLSDGGVFNVGLSVDPITGEMILSQVAEDLGTLMRAFDALVEDAFTKFNDPRNADHVTSDIAGYACRMKSEPPCSDETWTFFSNNVSWLSNVTRTSAPCCASEGSVVEVSPLN
jgi:hypothetical protein